MLVNHTIDDNSTQIAYSPQSSWHSSDVPCDQCLHPSEDLAYQHTWHDGIHIIPTVDADDVPKDDNAGSQPDGDGDNGGSQNGSSSNSGKGKTKGGGQSAASNFRRNWSREEKQAIASPIRRQDSDADDNPFFTPNFDSDDAGFVDHPVFAQFNFTGACSTL